MTFSICVRESYTDEDGVDQTRYGVAVTTRLAAVGTLCPFVSEHGAVATQAHVNVDLGRKGVDYLADGLAVEDALEALLAADEDSAVRQLHGVDSGGEFAFSGADCGEWFGHREREGVTVAGNLLTGPDVLEETIKAYAESDRSEPLSKRLVDALAAGHAEGGDKRTDLEVQSAALQVATSEDREHEPYDADLRVDATRTPIADLREIRELAVESFEAALEKYEEEGDDESQTQAEDDT